MKWWASVYFTSSSAIKMAPEIRTFLILSWSTTNTSFFKLFFKWCCVKTNNKYFKFLAKSWWIKWSNSWTSQSEFQNVGEKKTAEYPLIKIFSYIVHVLIVWLYLLGLWVHMRQKKDWTWFWRRCENISFISCLKWFWFLREKVVCLFFFVFLMLM